MGELAASQSLGGRARNLTEPKADMLWLQAERPGCLGSSGAAGFSGPKRYQVAVTYCRAPDLLSLYFYAYSLTLATDSLDNVVPIGNIIEHAHGLPCRLSTQFYILVDVYVKSESWLHQHCRLAVVIPLFPKKNGRNDIEVFLICQLIAFALVLSTASCRVFVQARWPRIAVDVIQATAFGDS